LLSALKVHEAREARVCEGSEASNLISDHKLGKNKQANFKKKLTA